MTSSTTSSEQPTASTDSTRPTSSNSKLSSALRWLWNAQAILLVGGVVFFAFQPGLWACPLLATVLWVYEADRRAGREQTRLAMESAADQAVARLEAEARVVLAQIDQETKKLEAVERSAIDALKKELGELQEKLGLLARPEQIEKLQAYFKQRLGVAR